MAGSKSRGAIEEGTATFSNESEKIINFQTSAQTQKFPFPPSVKVISIDGTGQDAGNANIHVSFTNVTINGMTILTSAPFTGTIRYLCSTNG